MKKAAKSKEKKVVEKVEAVEEAKETVENTEPVLSLFERALGKGKNCTIMTESASALADELRKPKTGKFDSSCIHKIK